MRVDGVYVMLDFKIDSFFVDRFWVLTYLRDSIPHRVCVECDYYREKRKSLIRDFEDKYSENGWAFYRTLNLFRLASRKMKRDIMDVVKSYLGGELKLDDLLSYVKYGNYETIRPLTYFGRDWFGKFLPVDYIAYIDNYGVTLDMFESVEVIERPLERGYDKFVYFAVVSDFFRVMYRPFFIGVMPPVIRILVNATRYALRMLEFYGKLNNELYEKSRYVHGNWYIEESGDRDMFMQYNRYIFEYDFRRIALHLWKWIFGIENITEDDVVVKVTQVEYTYDGFFDKFELLDVMRQLPGKSKTFSYSNSNKMDYVTWSSDAVAKFYVTMSNGVQVKTYSKAALPDGRVLNRIEFTVSTRKAKLSDVTLDVIKDFLVTYVNDINAMSRLVSSDVRTKVIALVDSLIPEGVQNRDEHREFLLNLFLFGSIEGSRRYNNLAEYYKRQGIIKVIGRGKASRYVLNPAYMAIHERLMEIFNELGLSLKDVKLEIENHKNETTEPKA